MSLVDSEAEEEAAGGEVYGEGGYQYEGSLSSNGGNVSMSLVDVDADFVRTCSPSSTTSSPLSPQDWEQ